MAKIGNSQTKTPQTSLQLIVKDEVEQVTKLVRQALPYVAWVNLTVSDETAAHNLKLEFSTNPQVRIVYRPWTHDFAAARNDNFALCKTAYAFWLDADDLFDFSEIPMLEQLITEDELDAIFLPYEYAHDDDGVCIAIHSRERLVRPEKFEWKGVIHETLVPFKRPNAERLDTPTVVHTRSDVESSLERNHLILVRETEGVQNPDPRYLYYRGLSHFSRREFKDAIKCLQHYVLVSGWDEEIYRATCKISECYSQLGRDDQAVQYALQAAAQLPQLPDAYWLMAQIEFEHERWDETLEWLTIAAGRGTPDTMSVTDPTAPARAIALGAMAEYERGNYAKSYELAKRARAGRAPLSAKLEAILKHEANKELFVNSFERLLPFVDDKLALYNALRTDLQRDIRLQWFKQMVFPPRIWSDNSIVFFCGKSYEEWGPHTLDKGMGGSEEAVVYLSRALTKEGFRVTVYNEVSDYVYDPVQITEDDYKYVQYIPWAEFDKRDHFDTVVLWRAPEFAEHVIAKTKIVDMHDAIEKDRVVDGDWTYFFKSQYHKELYGDVKSEVIGNGIDKSHFNV